MRHFVALLLAGSATAFLAPGPESQAPYLDDHNLEDHFTNIGLNATEVATEFENWDLLNAYHFVIPEGNSHVVHDLIRRDPGVLRVTHNHNWTSNISALDHIGWEGGCVTSNARNVYEHIEQNQIMAVTADQVIVDSGATTALLKIGIYAQAKPANQPYAGIPGKKRSVAPRQEVKDGDADMWESFGDPVLECEGVEKEQRWVERN
ncbi:hypothetical protein COL940_011801 [Colletotrichum noveboracense]|nr:hypothetical protein COL940_011801 [Colletotrichum noveboracense]